MSGVWELIEECQQRGAKLTARDGQLHVQAPKALPDYLFTALKESKEQILAEIGYRQRCHAACWYLEEWRRINIPAWRRILKESIESKDREREKYAHHMLQEILEDPDYKETQL